jgi:hypothetical protein
MFGGNGGGFFDASEIDMLEAYLNIYRNAANIDINDRVAPAGRTASPNAITSINTFLYNPNLWGYTAPNLTYNSATDYSGAYHHWQLYWTPDATYDYIDGTMVKASNYHWTSSRLAQVILNLAVGSLQNGIGTNDLFPLASANFPMGFNIKELTIRSK